ncbi:MAG: HAD hydrolase-like protein [Nanoarchaeota archaeon]
MTILLFDVGNVIVKADHEITYRKLQDYGVPGDISRLFFKNAEYYDFGRGKIDGMGFYRAVIEKYLGIPLEYQQVKDAHDSHLHEIDRAVVSILERIPKSQLAFATNTNDWQTEKERRLIDLTLYSDKIFRSNETHMLKTDNACFPHIVSQLHVESGQIILVDDNLENILKAREHGLKTIQFSNAGQLLRELERRGIIS